MSQRTWVVTGAAGHLGNLVVRAALEAGFAVRALVHRQRRALTGLSCEVRPCDVRDATAVREAVAGAEVVVHLAARISLSARDEAEMMAVNVDGTRNVVAACRASGARLLHGSSIHAFDPEPLDRAVDERRALATDPRHFAYDRSKALGEALVREAITDGLHAVIVNPTAMLGPNDFGPSELGGVFRRLITGTMPGLVEASFDWVDARDVTAAIMRLVDAGAGTRLVLPGHRESMPQLARRICDVAQVKAPKMVSPLWLAKATAPFAVGWARISGGVPLYTSASLATLGHYRDVDGGLAKQLIGWQPRLLADTVADTVAWWREELASGAA